MNQSGGTKPGSALLDIEAIQRTLEALVSINSVNPAHEGPAGGERRVLEWCAAFLKKHGVAAELRECPDNHLILRARIEGRRPGAPIMFETHVDTVSIKNMSIAPFEPFVRDGRLYGRGSVDAKGQVAAMLHAFAAWAELGRVEGSIPPQPVELALVMDEEVGFSGAKALLNDGIQAAGIVIGEPTDLRVVTTHKGSIRWWIECKGRAAHGARPELGINAISAAAALIAEINETLIPQLQERTAPLLRPPTINIGRIEGGIQVNLVPPTCRIQVDRRMIPGESEEVARRELEALFPGVKRRFNQFEAHVEPATLIAQPLATDPESALSRAARAVTGRMGNNSEPLGVDYATDACVLVGAGVPVIIVGPGSIDQAHTADEYIELEALQAGARFYAELIGEGLGA